MVSQEGLKARPSTVAGVKRPASLLPAFELFSSSPSFPRPAKRLARVPPSERDDEMFRYPTPAPTSSTGMISSSPPKLPLSRPGLQRTQSTVSERAPLSAVPSVTLSINGESVLMGRSSNSSHYQLSANRLISRVHVRAAYIPASSSLDSNKVEIICMGWNGVKVHCQGRTWDLAKGDSFTSETELAEIMLDVQDARVLVEWPRQVKTGSASVKSGSTCDDEISPRRALAAIQDQLLELSPLRHIQRLQSPVSPTPAGHSNLLSSSTFPACGSANRNTVQVQVYEDEPSSDDKVDHKVEVNGNTQSTQHASQLSVKFDGLIEASQSSTLSDLQDFSDQDEENDPIIHSFGPQGDNLLPRLASFTTGSSPERRPHTHPLSEASISPQRHSDSEATRKAGKSSIMNHVVNQLAFSRLSSTPISTILSNLPAELKGDRPLSRENRKLSLDDLQKILQDTPCVGKVSREGKDAAGKPLESEFYYVPDFDEDEIRRDAVVDGMKKPGLRACRKQHKVS
ncbi:MAG: hypothetical protein M1827_001765 [Pycnora praestabilis]|nr:MAG: hypothetical protein M1827_001765 [Pycnora praestabilis]